MRIVVFTLFVVFYCGCYVQSVALLPQNPQDSKDAGTWTETAENASESAWSFGVFNPRFHVEAEEISDAEWQIILEEELRRHQVIDEIIDQVPSHVINVNYERHTCVHLGNRLSPSETKLAPEEVSYPSNGTNSMYTLLAIDPDVPRRHDNRYSEYLHWLIVNIPGDNVDQGDTLVDYLGPLPSQGAGLHRFIFLVYRQTERIDTLQFPHAGTCDFSLRARFDCRKFARLQTLGDPVAVNYFITAYDDTVPQVLNSCLY